MTLGLIPAIAAECGHVTMLQRTPTYFRIGRNAVPIADELRSLGLPTAPDFCAYGEDLGAVFQLGSAL